MWNYAYIDDVRVRILTSILLWAIASPTLAQYDIQVHALFKNTAVISFNGQQRMLKAGKTSPEGITLISANTQEAVIEYEGNQHTLSLSRRVGGKFAKADTAEVRVPRGRGNHYIASGKINGYSTNFIVDTGATTVTMNAAMAQQLRVDYSDGRPVSVGTANGTARGYRVTLRSVSVGTVKVNNVEAIVLTGDSPPEVLLGNSYLSRVEMKVENELLVLKAKL
ncbi:hypothetical protein TDB9533_02664 [Thalassocella blandensis]|nr:hypothetical protein TDB9533_02664 [Thalassocella blandensis]